MYVSFGGYQSELGNPMELPPLVLPLTWEFMFYRTPGTRYHRWIQTEEGRCTRALKQPCRLLRFF